MITPELLTDAKLCDAGQAGKWAPFLQEAADKFEINTPERVAGWLAQCAHESGHFRFLEENLNYSQQALLSVFPKYFDQITSASYSRQPEKIANRVYASRMGNGVEASGEGYKFRGRGVIQLTGKANYTAFGDAIGRKDEILNSPELVSQPELASLSAAWFWGHNGINRFADQKDIKAMTKAVNGGVLGLDDRTKLYAQLCSALSI